MPIYEFTCRACSADFEELVRGDEAVECPSCHTRKVEKRLSAFATSSSGSRADVAARARAESAGGCGTCGDPRGPGACSMN